VGNTLNDQPDGGQHRGNNPGRKIKPKKRLCDLAGGSYNETILDRATFNSEVSKLRKQEITAGSSVVCLVIGKKGTKREEKAVWPRTPWGAKEMGLRF